MPGSRTGPKALPRQLSKDSREERGKLATEGVEFADVSFTVAGGRLLLQGISFRCEPGTTTALLGRSGSGKTTLLRTVNGLVRPTSGRVLVNGQDVARVDPLTLRRGIGYVIQESGLFPHMTVSRNVTMSYELAGRKDQPDLRSEAQAAIERVGLEPQVLDRFPWQLSGGQRQRVGVARALLSKPKVLLMDEPLGALDPLTRAEVQTMLSGVLRQSGTTTLIVTHDLQEAVFLADRIVLMEAGRVVANVPAREAEASTEPHLQQYVQATRPRTEAA